MRILVVDDKDPNRYYLEALLRGHGHEVETAAHGAEALARARQRPPDLVVSDLLMPVMDGYALLRHWKADAALRRAPFIVYTATYTEPKDEQLAMDLGADGFILKPAEPEDFLRRVDAVMARVPTDGPARPVRAAGNDDDLMEAYSRTLIRKLEEKTFELDAANRALQRDIEDRVRAEEAAEAAHAELRRTAIELKWQAELLDKAKDAILERDLDLKVRYWNKSAERLYGWTADEARGRSIVDLIYAGSTAFEAANAEVMSKGEWSGEIEQRRKDGQAVIVEGHWTLVRDAQGHPRSVLAINTDITRRRALEQQFLRAQRLESIGTLAGGIAHDLNNVLAPIIMSIGLLKQTLQKPENLEILDLIEASATRGADMVAQVLSFARGAESRRIPTSMSHVVRDVLRIASETFPKNITLDAHVASDLPALQADPTQLHQVLLNLCVNARDAMPNGGRIDILAAGETLDAEAATRDIDARPGPYVRIQVRDTGSGIPPEMLDKIFDPFFTTKEVGKGTGLGLSTTLAIVKNHGGFIQVESQAGKGTCFTLYLPAQGVNLEATVPVPATPLPRGRGETVLVVDDELSIRQIARQTLEAFGYRVLVAANGSEAVSVYAERQDDIGVVVVDMMMPVMDGPAMIRILRRINPAVRLIAASGQNTADYVARATGEGVRRFLPKPYNAETLLGAVREALDAI